MIIVNYLIELKVLFQYILKNSFNEIYTRNYSQNSSLTYLTATFLNISSVYTNKLSKVWRLYSSNVVDKFSLKFWVAISLISLWYLNLNLKDLAFSKLIFDKVFIDWKIPSFSSAGDLLSWFHPFKEIILDQGVFHYKLLTAFVN